MCCLRLHEGKIQTHTQRKNVKHGKRCQNMAHHHSLSRLRECCPCAPKRQLTVRTRTREIAGSLSEPRRLSARTAGALCQNRGKLSFTTAGDLCWNRGEGGGGTLFEPREALCENRKKSLFELMEALCSYQGGFSVRTARRCLVEPQECSNRWRLSVRTAGGSLLKPQEALCWLR